jgi:hypothetical protein
VQETAKVSAQSHAAAFESGRGHARKEYVMVDDVVSNESI